MKEKKFTGKFKVGDEVYLLDGSKISNFAGGWLKSIMGKYVGEIAEIINVNNIDEGYNIKLLKDGDTFFWDERAMIEEPKKESIVIYNNGRVVTAINKNTKEKAVAKCNPSDKFDFKIGAALAFNRLMHRFKIGDWVIGNDEANAHYCVTKKGWAGKVVYVSDDGSEMRVTNNSSDTWGYNVICERFDYYIPTDEELKKFKPKPKWTAKVVCVEKATCFTVGKVYEVTNGKLYDDDGKVRLSGKIDSLEYLNQRIGNGKFLEIVE